MAQKPNSEALGMLFNNKIYLIEKDNDTPTESIPDQEENVIETPKTATEIQEIAPEPIQYLGSNLKNVFMLFNGGPMPEWPTERKHTFMKILQSIGLNFNDISCCGASELKNKNTKDLESQLNTKVLFLWGVAPEEFKLECNQFEIVSSDNMKVASLPALSEIEGNQELKRQLWECIRNLSF